MRSESKLPFLILFLFLFLTALIWLAGKIYSPNLSEATVYRGEAFTTSMNNQLVEAQGLITSSYINPEGMTFLNVRGDEGKFGVSFFPSLGQLPFTPREGDVISVIGILDQYEMKPQISPLSAASIELQIQHETDKSLQVPTIGIEQLENYSEQLVWLENIRCISIAKFRSRKGNKMLRFKLSDPLNQSVEGVFFEGDWNESTYKRLKERNHFSILAEVSNFQGKVSIIGKRIS